MTQVSGVCRRGNISETTYQVVAVDVSGKRNDYAPKSKGNEDRVASVVGGSLRPSTAEWIPDVFRGWEVDLAWHFHKIDS